MNIKSERMEEFETKHIFIDLIECHLTGNCRLQASGYNALCEIIINYFNNKKMHKNRSTFLDVY